MTKQRMGRDAGARVVKALTLTQPYASLVACGAKRVETRSWKTDYRGPIVIHASASFHGVGGKWAADSLYWINGIHDVLRRVYGFECIDDLPRGVVLCKAELITVDTTWEIGRRLPREELILGDYGPGRYAWVLDDVDPFLTPIPAKGALGLWDFEMPERAS